jgi:hypothetical protein
MLGFDDVMDPTENDSSYLIGWLRELSTREVLRAQS